MTASHVLEEPDQGGRAMVTGRASSLLVMFMLAAPGSVHGAYLQCSSLFTKVKCVAYAGDEAKHQDQEYLDIERVINYSGGVRSNLKWTADDKVCPRNQSCRCPPASWPDDVLACRQHIIFPSKNTVVIMEAPRLPESPEAVDEGKGDPLPPAAKQTFLFGHTAVITALEVSPSGLLLATGQEVGTTGAGRLHTVHHHLYHRPNDERKLGRVGWLCLQGSEAMVRVWDLSREVCIGAVRAHESDLLALAFSPDETLLCTVGHDSRKRLQIKVGRPGRGASGPRRGSESRTVGPACLPARCGTCTRSAGSHGGGCRGRRPGPRRDAR
jgi:hypothetical protein